MISVFIYAKETAYVNPDIAPQFTKYSHNPLGYIFSLWPLMIWSSKFHRFGVEIEGDTDTFSEIKLNCPFVDKSKDFEITSVYL